ncbi:jg2052, partial [Pararge aegeria aegeria]
MQAVTQVVLSVLSIAQYLGFIDFLRELPHLIFIKILYYHNPARHGNVITIGHAIEGIANQAFVLIPKEPFTATRTFIINCTYLSLGFLWAISSSILLAGGTLNEYSRPIRWPWVAVTVAVCAVDLVATVIFANDSFHTR